MNRAHGFALASCLLLLTVLAILAVAGFTAALVEMRIAANVAERDRAFQAAEFGIEQALQAPVIATTHTTVAPLLEPAGGGSAAVPGATADTYTNRLYFAGSTPSGLPPAHPAASLTAFHFVIEATGTSARRASSRLVQSFKVLRPAGWVSGPADATCAAGDPACVVAPMPAPVRTSWVEAEAE
jgi:hypothetical protein